MASLSFFSLDSGKARPGTLILEVMNMPEVKCTVANCGFWTQGNRCNAASIQIEVDQHAESNLNEEFAVELGSKHQDEADDSANTCCQTFVPKR